MTAPVTFAGCSEPVLEGQAFVDLNRSAGGNPDFEPLVVKAAYALGTMLDIFESVSQLLRHEQAWQVTYRSAFGVFAVGSRVAGTQSVGEPHSLGQVRSRKRSSVCLSEWSDHVHSFVHSGTHGAAPSLRCAWTGCRPAS